MAWSTSNRRERLPADWAWRTSEVFRLQGRRCKIQWDSGCLGRATEVDHKAAGDNHDLDNLQPACRHCHARKSAAEGNAMKTRLRALRTRPARRHPGWRPPPKKG